MEGLSHYFEHKHICMLLKKSISTSVTKFSGLTEQRKMLKRIISWSTLSYLPIQRWYCSLCFLPCCKRDEPISSRSSFRSIKDNPGWNGIKIFRNKISKMAWSCIPFKIRHINLMACLSRTGARSTRRRRFFESLCKLDLNNSPWYFLHQCFANCKIRTNQNGKLVSPHFNLNDHFLSIKTGSLQIVPHKDLHTIVNRKIIRWNIQ